MPDPTSDANHLLKLGVTTAHDRLYSRTPDEFAQMLLTLDWSRHLAAAVLARALYQLAEPARIGDLRDLREVLTENLYDSAHSVCGCEGALCAGGGRDVYEKLVDNVILPTVRHYADPVNNPGPVL